MKITYSFQRYDNLSRENIQKAVDMAITFFEENSVEYRYRTLARLLLEDILLGYRERDESKGFEIIYRRRRRRIIVNLRVNGESCNVLDESRDFYTDLQRSIDILKPVWAYRIRKNDYEFELGVIVPDRKAVKYVLSFMDNEKGSFRTGVLMRFLNMVMLVLEPWMAAKIIEAINSADTRGIMVYALWFLAIEAGSSVFTFLGTRLLQRAYNNMRERMRTELTVDILRVKTEHIDAAGTGVFTERLVRETARVIDGIDEVVLVITEAFRLISLLVAFASISPMMLVYELVLFVIYLLLVQRQSKKRTEDARRMYAATEDYSGFVGEMIRAARDIKLLHCEGSFMARAREVIRECTQRERETGERNNKRTLSRTQFVAWTDFIYLAILALTMGRYGLAPATALVLYNFNGRVFASTRAVAGAADSLYSVMLSSERIYQLMASDDFAREDFGEKTLENVRGEIELKDISFSYKPRDHEPVPVLEGLNLHIPAGQSVALVGRSGCGKSTVLSLISRLYDPDGGCVTLDGVDCMELSRDAIRDNIGMVTQSPYLFSMSLWDNFRLVKEGATEEEIIAVCKTACVHDEIMKLPEGYDTVIGEGGSRLSGGQRQRIALARALLKDYPVIMLDEATSALDNETQASIRDAIENMQGGRTVIMIAHRLSTVIHCEQLFVIEDGKVQASGTHEELLKTCEMYRRLYAEESCA